VKPKVPDKDTERDNATIHHADTAGIEAVLRTTDQVEFYLIEEVSGYSMQVITRSASPEGKSRFVIELVRGRGIRTWKHAETAFQFIKKVCPANLRPSRVTVIFKQPEMLAKGERELES